MITLGTKNVYIFIDEQKQQVQLIVNQSKSNLSIKTFTDFIKISTYYIVCITFLYYVICTCMIRVGIGTYVSFIFYFSYFLFGFICT